MNRSALRTASQRAAAKAKADEDAKKAAAAAETDETEASEDDEEETEASEDDCDTDDDAPNPPVKKPAGKKASKPAAKGALSPRAAERQRIQAIMGSDEAEGREDLAEHLAYETEMSAKAVIAMLAKAPQAAVQASEPVRGAGKSKFEQAMEATAKGDGKVASGKGKGGTVAHADMSDDEFTASVVGFAAKYGLAKA